MPRTNCAPRSWVRAIKCTTFAPASSTSVGRTRSTLLSKGAVADSSRSVYTGLIEIEKGAKRTDARQTNHNLLLSPHAHADSVPNLDIRENDVMCAHASSVGPLDELQRWYLESRGVTRPDAERLMIQGFFYEMLATLPPELAERGRTRPRRDVAPRGDRDAVTTYDIGTLEDYVHGQAAQVKVRRPRAGGGAHRRRRLRARRPLQPRGLLPGVGRGRRGTL